MPIPLPARLGWWPAALLALLLLQSGCAPIQPITPAESPLAATPTPENSVTTTEQFTSPNGEWIATSTLQTPRPGDEYYQRFVVEKVDGSIQYSLLDGYAPFGLGYTVMKPKSWSQDGTRLYYGNVPHPDGCALFLDASDLYELDLATGESRGILPPDSAWTLSVSPDSKRVAYHARNQDEKSLYVLDMASYDYTMLDVAPILGDSDQLGEIVWSPDNNHVAFVVAHQPCMGGWAAATSIYTVNIQEMSLTPHLQRDERPLIPAAWPTPDELILAIWDADTWSKGQAFILNLTDNSVTPAE
ncbi:MAG: hypothetical protein IT328_04675 [Caldilineaceae bacterium]|nr:hypothetical protein [Caldilineaceae bacterium]